MKAKWSAIVPFRGTAGSKSRLIVPGSARPSENALRLASAFAADLIEALAAARRVGSVLIVSARGGAGFASDGFDCEWILDSGKNLNTAAEAGIAAARAHHPDRGAVVLPADLPLVRGSDIDEMLDTADDHSSAYVSDRGGTGTSALTLRPDFQGRPRFGADSAAAHRRNGFAPLPVDPAHPVRWDIDTYDDLVAARPFGFGPRTEEVLENLLRETAIAPASGP
ncbi:2-phospho-L-lactate guanylyltransferase [Leucobacter weissii]|uniref:2-phospho-L-lactate guanylyltransferase n=1 Tax=Leucobacter weissii TaxID=1983706 RepID=A0A939MIX6_9MICO|nr:2-phospho-L-lactate guanylyltransferase [Leucobacter weissii]MBO1901426.1 2-phospho-L-lactate guanylyltransferase [Leucobacter weissii]